MAISAYNSNSISKKKKKEVRKASCQGDQNDCKYTQAILIRLKYIVEDFQINLYYPTAPAHQVYTPATYASLSEEPYIQLHLIQHFLDQRSATIPAFGHNRLPITGTYSEIFLHHLAIRSIAA